MNIINDKTIEHNTAKYWCIFSDKKFVNFLDSLVKESISLATLAGYAGIALTATSIARIVSPFFKNMWRKVLESKDGRLAEVQFKADGSSYTAYFDMKDMKWKLHGTTSINTHETIQFFETKFFNDFNQQCIKYIEPIFQSKDQILQAFNKSNMKGIDSKYKKFLTNLLNNVQKIRANMFNPHYMT